MKMDFKIKTVFNQPFLRILAVFLFLMGQGREVLAQQVSVKARVDSSSILLGDQFHLILSGQVDTTHDQLSWAQIPDTFNHLLVVERGKIDTSRMGKSLLFNQVITLTGFDSGNWTIPSFPFPVVSLSDTASREVTTDSLLVVVNTVAVDTTQPFLPIKTVRSVPVDWRDYLIYIILGILAILLGILFWIWWKKRKPHPVGPLLPSETPYEWAIKKLKELESEKIWQRGEVKIFYTRLTDILREYFELQFQVKAMELTTDELLQSIQPITILNQQKSSIQIILRTADLVKFAKLKPAPEEHQVCLTKAREILDWTQPKNSETSKIEEGDFAQLELKP
ncbi:MAG: hypothetical protein ACYCOO_06065 [Chitinophagaceae bacterium]